MPDNIYVTRIIDKNGNAWWLYEEIVQGKSIWTDEKNSNPLYLNEVEAEDIAKTEVRDGQH